MAIGGMPNGRAQAEEDDADEQNYGVLADNGLDVQLVDNTSPHLHAVVDAIEYKDVDALRHALDVLNSMNIDINEAVEDCDTALHRACFHGDLSCVQLLLERGASLEVKDEFGGIPLHDACLSGNKEVVQHLLNAARSPHIVKRMLETADSGQGDTVFYQPLHHAASTDHSEVIRVMLAAGADPKRRNAYGKTPVELLDQDSEARRIFDEFNRNVPHG